MLKNLQNNFRIASLKQGIKLSAIAIATFCSSSVFAQDATYNGGTSTVVYGDIDPAAVKQNTVPADKTSVTIKMWGAGGNGGGSGPTNSVAQQSAGGGAGSGAYTLITIPVVPGDVYSVTVGFGAPNPTQNIAGRNGYDSFVTKGGVELGRAEGGKGGLFEALTGAGGGAGGATTGGGLGSVAGNTGSAGVIGTSIAGGAGAAGVAPLDGETPAGGPANVYPGPPTDTHTGFVNAPGKDGTGVGSGGAGGVSDGRSIVNRRSGQKGGLGSPGRVIFTYSPTVLPVSLISFNATVSNNQAKLSWETASESNNNRFEVQRSTDNKIYTTVATITGKGTTSQKSSYTAYDANPENGVNYYRLVQIDNDGTTIELAIKSVNFSFAKVASVSVYPNPASGVLNVNINATKAQTAKATLTGSNGAIYLSQVLQLNSGANTATFNLNSNVASGQYILNVAGTDLQESIKVMIK